MIDGLGMPGRARAYSDVSYRNLEDGGVPDHIAVLRQLGDRYPSLDLSRVGIFGHSAGGYASTRAIFAYPDFFKVCVSSAGNHDHRLDKAVWVERYMGLPVGDHYREQANQSLAHQLKGKLLLIHGEMDENVHPASTMVVVDALDQGQQGLRSADYAEPVPLTATAIRISSASAGTTSSGICSARSRRLDTESSRPRHLERRARARDVPTIRG